MRVSVFAKFVCAAEQEKPLGEQSRVPLEQTWLAASAP